VYCVTKNGAARCAGHDTAIRLELRFSSRRCREERRRVGPERRYFGSRRGVPTKTSRRRTSIRQILRDRSTAADSSSSQKEHTLCHVAYVRVCARKPGDSRASFHKFLPADVLPGITARRFTAKPVLAKSCLRRRDIHTRRHEDEEMPPGTVSSVC